MIAILKKDIVQDSIREVLSYVPSAIFPEHIFTEMFVDSAGAFDLAENPKILAAIIATWVGIFSRSILATIFSGLASYWAIIFI